MGAIVLFISLFFSWGIGYWMGRNDGEDFHGPTPPDAD